MAELEVPLRITVLHPLAGVTLMLQRGKDELVAPSSVGPDAISFDFVLRAGTPPVQGRPRWLGPFAQGTPQDRFVYVNVGRHAGQPGTPWDRRAKIKLAGITSEQVRAVLARPGQVLEARFEGRGRDGGPACATVPLVGAQWHVVTPNA